MIDVGIPWAETTYEENHIIFVPFINFTMSPQGTSGRPPLTSPKHSWNRNTTIATTGVVSNP